MPTSSVNGRRSRGRTGKRWDNLRRRWMRTSRICHLCQNLIPEGPEYAWPHPLSYTVDHDPIPLCEMDGPDDPRSYSMEFTKPAHLVCNQRKGAGKVKKKEPTSRDWFL